MNIYQFIITIIIFCSLIFSFVVGIRYSYESETKKKIEYEARIKSSQSQENDFDFKKVSNEELIRVNKEILNV